MTMNALGKSLARGFLGMVAAQILAFSPDGMGAVPVAGSLDDTWRVRSHLAGLRGQAIQPDGKVLVWGIATLSVTNGGGVSYERGLIRLNQDGSTDSTFAPFRELVMAVAVQADGRMVVGGAWGPGPEARPANIGRLNADGSWDDSFRPGTGTDLDPNPAVVSIYVTALTMQPDGKILAGGTFGAMAGEKRPGLARLNADGTLDPEFRPVAPTGSSFGGALVQRDGKILIGAAFANGSGSYTMRLLRLAPDGTLDRTFLPSTRSGISPGGFETMLALQQDGKILGTILNNGTQTNLTVGRMNPDGTRDASFDVKVRLAGASPSINLGYVAAMAVQPNGKIVMVGRFDSVNGSTRRGIARLNTDGSLDPEFDLAASLEPVGSLDVRGLSLVGDGMILVLGNGITKANGVEREAAVRFFGDPPLRLGAVVRGDDGVLTGRLLPNLTGTVGLEVSTDLKVWQTAETTNDSDGTIRFRVNPSSGPGLFFRGIAR